MKRPMMAFATAALAGFLFSLRYVPVPPRLDSPVPFVRKPASVAKMAEVKPAPSIESAMAQKFAGLQAQALAALRNGDWRKLKLGPQDEMFDQLKMMMAAAGIDMQTAGPEEFLRFCSQELTAACSLAYYAIANKRGQRYNQVLAMGLNPELDAEVRQFTQMAGSVALFACVFGGSTCQPFDIKLERGPDRVLAEGMVRERCGNRNLPDCTTLEGWLMPATEDEEGFCPDANCTERQRNERKDEYFRVTSDDCAEGSNLSCEHLIDNLNIQDPRAVNATLNLQKSCDSYTVKNQWETSPCRNLSRALRGLGETQAAADYASSGCDSGDMDSCLLSVSLSSNGEDQMANSMLQYCALAKNYSTKLGKAESKMCSTLYSEAGPSAQEIWNTYNTESGPLHFWDM